MLIIKKMTPEDYPFAVQLTDKMSWNLAEDDFQFMTELEPEGCFTLYENEEKIGIATTITYNHIGWFGNLIVKEDYRKKGAGSHLVKHALAYLKTKNVKTTGLYAYLDKIAFYQKLGFKTDIKFRVMTGKSFTSIPELDIREAGKQDLKAITELDEVCFGAPRKRMLEPIISDRDNLCLIYSKDDEIKGFAVAKVYRGKAELGPLVCPKNRSDLATKVVKTALNRLINKEVSLLVPETEKPILNMLRRLGFRRSFDVVRMFHGSATLKECSYMPESLERG